MGALCSTAKGCRAEWRKAESYGRSYAEILVFPYRSYVIVSRQRLRENFRAVCRTVGPGVTVAAVVKAEAYGHGMLEVARLLEAEGARWLAVSSVEEGVCLRDAGIRTHVLVMAGVLPYEWETVVVKGLTPVVHALEELPMLESAAVKASVAAGFHLKIDSGMGRLGTRASAEQIAAALEPLRAASLQGLMTHFASAADFTTSQTDQQVATFEAMTAELGQLGVTAEFLHLSSTNAMAYPRPQSWKSMVRPGHAIYGYVSPARGSARAARLQVKPALTWRARVVAVKDLPAGAPVGYGASFVAPQPMRIAVVAAGYADGVQHRLGNRGKMIACGKLAPIVGTVSMDLTTIDVSAVPELRAGDEVTLLGSEGEVSLDAQQIARTAGTISYNVLCAIKPRVRRIYEE